MYGQLQHNLWKLEHGRMMQNSYKSTSTGQFDWDDENEDEDDGHAPEPLEIKFHGDHALNYLRHLKCRMGVFDMLLPKMVELTAHYQGKEEVVNLLMDHLNNNSDNPNSYRYLLHYLTREESCFDQKLYVSTLEKLSQIDPTHEMVKQYLNHLNDSKDYLKLIHLLLKRLDHADLFQSAFDWGLLFELLNEEDENIVKLVKEEVCLCCNWTRNHFQVPLSKADHGADHAILELKRDISQLLGIGESDCTLLLSPVTFEFYDLV